MFLRQKYNASPATNRPTLKLLPNRDVTAWKRGLMGYGCVHVMRATQMLTDQGKIRAKRENGPGHIYITVAFIFSSYKYLLVRHIPV